MGVTMKKLIGGLVFGLAIFAAYSFPTVGRVTPAFGASCFEQTSACFAPCTAAERASGDTPPVLECTRRCLAFQKTCVDAPRPQHACTNKKAAGCDMADGDPSTRNITCDEGRRGDRSSCMLGPAGPQGTWKFRLHIGKKLPIFQGASMIICQGETHAEFYPNGRIKSCTIGGDPQIGLSDTSNRPKTCNNGSNVEFDDVGRVLSCD